MTQENLGNYAFAVPKGEIEKCSIANFLDHETAKIDTLIEKQQQLIAPPGGKAAGSDQPCRDQRVESRCPDEGLRG